MKVFLSHSIAPEDGPVASRLRAVAAAYGIKLMLPDRSAAVAGTPTKAVRKQILDADAVVLLATEGAILDPHVPAEVEFALEEGVPMLALLEDGVEADFLEDEEIVHFDRHNQALHERGLIEALESLRTELREADEKAAQTQAIGWLAGLAIGLVGLGAIAAALVASDNEEDEDEDDQL